MIGWKNLFRNSILVIRYSNIEFRVSNIPPELQHIQIANVVEGLRIGCRVRSRGSANRRLIDTNDLVYGRKPLDAPMRAHADFRAVQLASSASEADEAGQRECRWQRERLPDRIRELVVSDQKLRAAKFKSAFDC